MRDEVEAGKRVRLALEEANDPVEQGPGGDHSPKRGTGWSPEPGIKDVGCDGPRLVLPTEELRAGRESSLSTRPGRGSRDPWGKWGCGLTRPSERSGTPSAVGSCQRGVARWRRPQDSPFCPKSAGAWRRLGRPREMGLAPSALQRRRRGGDKRAGRGGGGGRGRRGGNWRSEGA